MASRRFSWHLADVMRDRGILKITALQRQLSAHGIELSSSQIHRLVTGVPERLNLEVLSALCEILACSPTDLVEVHPAVVRQRATAANVVDMATTVRPRRARVVRPEDEH
jgi:DNA-binding Xre family transcriptional regulator